MNQTLQASLPLEFLDRVQLLRSRYGIALLAAGQGNYTYAQELRAVSRQVGRLLAEEARKGPQARGGLRMLDISLAVDQLLPELRGWNQWEAQEQQRRRLLCAQVLPAPVRRKGRRAS